LAKAGLVNGFGDGKYGPDDILTREQMAQVLTNAFKFKATKTSKFADVDKNSWSYGAISALEENGVTIGTGGNMYSSKMFVTREAYSQFLYNSINAVEPETKPEVPEGLDVDLVQPDFKYHPEGLKNSNIQPHLTLEAQNLVKEINKKYNTNLKYKDLQGSVHMMDTGMYYPEGSYIGGQFVVYGDKNDLDLTFLDNNPATVELTKRWITYVTGLNLDKEIQETVDADSINNYEKGNYKIRVGQTMVKDMMYVQIKAN
ncbi:cell surface protein, partial [Bacillus thuringiensis]|uniref:S-layer homology domain-containing protein n=1 Tax=Bacillus thuringiensis TaxID=1428 RepID=UPI000BFB021D